MIKDLIRGFFLIFVAEMGDKTQIIAMTFATKFTISQVVLGIVCGVVLNHGLAIILGNFLAKVTNFDLIQIIAGIMFIIFGIMSLKDDKLEDMENKKDFSPILTVGLAFFIGELGDKTQLTAMSLSIDANYPIFILIGTTLGMVATSLMGIFVGSKIGDKIPDIGIKIVSSIVFISLGSIKLGKTLPKRYLSFLNISLYYTLILAIFIYLIRRLILLNKERKSAIKEAAQRLYIQTREIEKALDHICLGEEKCGSCIGASCIIGYTRYILKEAREKEEYSINHSIDIDSLANKGYNSSSIIEALSLIIVDTIKNNWSPESKFVINEIRSVLEKILFHQEINSKLDFKEYINHIKNINPIYGKELEKSINEKLKEV